MGKNKENKNQGNPLSFNQKEKTAFIVGMIAAAVVLLMSLLDLANVKFDVLYIMYPAMAVMLGAQGVREWRRQKLSSLFTFAVAVLLIVITVKKIVA